MRSDELDRVFPVTEQEAVALAHCGWVIVAEQEKLVATREIIPVEKDRPPDE